MALLWRQKTFPQAYVVAWTNDGGLLLDYCFEKLSGVDENDPLACNRITAIVFTIKAIINTYHHFHDYCRALSCFGGAMLQASSRLGMFRQHSG